MRASSLGRAVFGLNAVVVAVGVVVQLPAAADAEGGFFTEPADRVLNTFAYFTVLSNLLVGITTALLALGRGTSGTVFRVLRLDGVVAIALTFLVFHAVLRDLQDLTGQAAVADVLLHTVSPILCVGGWLLFGPRGQTTWAVVALSLVYLVVWGVFTLVRGEAVGFYPYPFMDVTAHGYARVAVNLTLVAAVFVALAAGAHLLDRWLTRRAPAGAGAPA